MTKKIKTVLLCGYLGAGKTTLLSNLLESQEFAGQKIAVLVNEFGKLHIDAKLLPDGDYYSAEINNGSIFCVCVKTDLLRSLEMIAAEIEPDILFIEASGIAEPSDFKALLNTEFLKESYSKGPNVCVVDCLNFPKLKGMLRALPVQVKSADIVLLNKTDLVDENSITKVENEIKSINDSALIQRTSYCSFPIVILLEKLEKEISRKAAADLSVAPPDNTFSCELKPAGTLNEEKFYAFLRKYANNILRGKGVINFENSNPYIEIINGTVYTHENNKLKSEEVYGMCFILRDISSLEFSHKFNKEV